MVFFSRRYGSLTFNGGHGFRAAIVQYRIDRLAEENRWCDAGMSPNQDRFCDTVIAPSDIPIDYGFCNSCRTSHRDQLNAPADIDPQNFRCTSYELEDTFVNQCKPGYYLDTSSWRNTRFISKIHDPNWGGTEVMTENDDGNQIGCDNLYTQPDGYVRNHHFKNINRISTINTEDIFNDAYTLIEKNHDCTDFFIYNGQEYTGKLCMKDTSQDIIDLYHDVNHGKLIDQLQRRGDVGIVIKFILIMVNAYHFYVMKMNMFPVMPVLLVHQGLTMALVMMQILILTQPAILSSVM